MLLLPLTNAFQKSKPMQLASRLPSTIARILCVAILQAIAWVSLSLCAYGQLDRCLPREWSDYTGAYKTAATLKGLDGEFVVLSKANGETVRVKIRNLSDQDKSYLVAFNSLKDSPEAAVEASKVHQDLVDSLIQLESSQNLKKIEAAQKHQQLVSQAITRLWEMHETDENVISGFIAGTLLSLGKDPRTGSIGRATPVQLDEDQVRRAQRYLEASLERLRNTEKHFPSSYPITFASVLNNLAVLCVKSGQPGRAAVLFGESCINMPQSHIAPMHNANLLLRLGSEKKSVFALSKSQSNQLSEAVASLKSLNETINLPNLFLYSTDFDSAMRKSSTSSRSLEMSDLFRFRLIPEHTCFICRGKGIIDCRGCANGVVNTSTVRAVGINPSTGRPAFASVPDAKSCDACDGRGIFKCQACDNGQIR